MTLLLEAWAATVLDAAVRWTLPLLLVVVLARAVRFSAAARAFLWALLLAGLLLLPLAASLLPAYRVDMPTALAPVGAARAAVLAETMREPNPSTAPAPPSDAAPAYGSGTSREAGARRREVPTAPGSASRSVLPTHRAVWAWVWASIAAGLLAFWMAGQLLVRRLGRRCCPAPAAQRDLLRDCTRRLGIHRPVRLLLCREESIPMTWGWILPTILLPASSTAWPVERLRRVLLHELAHAARFDCMSQGAARAACALFWFHPGVWFAARALRREAEMACDDRVVEVDGASVGYAADLLGIARALRPAALARAALPMAQRSGLELRVRRLLQPGVRRGLSGATAALLAVGLFAVVGGLAMVRWAQTSGRSGVELRDWLEVSALADGRTAWTLDCGSVEVTLCQGATRRALALLERTGRTGAVVAQRVATGEVVMYAAVQPSGADRAEAVPHAAPGSVAKLALAALWWERGGGDRPVPCPPEAVLPSGRTIANVGGHGFGAIPAERMLVVSCNTAALAMASSLADELGTDGFGRALGGMGLGETVGVGDEALLLAGLGIGGGTASPLHVSRFLQAVGNGGWLIEPRPAAQSPGAAPPVRLLQASVADRLQQAMLRVVREGTAARTLPQLEWSRWSLGGKTGTVPDGAGETDGWFAGLAHRPDGRAEYTIVVLVEGGGAGGGAPAGIAAEMTRFFARAQGDEL